MLSVYTRYIQYRSGLFSFSAMCDYDFLLYMKWRLVPLVEEVKHLGETDIHTLLSHAPILIDDLPFLLLLIL